MPSSGAWNERYNNTLVTGVKIPSPDAKYRYFPMDLFPSDMLERLEVIKSLTPSMEADAVGGTMNPGHEVGSPAFPFSTPTWASAFPRFFLQPAFQRLSAYCRK